MDLLSCGSDDSWTSMMRDPVVSEFWSDAMSTDDSYTGSSSVCETPRSPSSCDGADGVDGVEMAQFNEQNLAVVPTLPIVSEPEKVVLESFGPTVEEFMMSASCGLISPSVHPLAAAKNEVDLSSLVTRVVVRRREMNAANPLFHSIRTRTASVVSVCFFGSEAQVSAISQRAPRIFFGVESFQTAAESLKTNLRDILLLVKMRNVNECAHFAFSHGALTVPPPVIYAAPESLNVASLAPLNPAVASSADAQSQPLYACVLEFVLAAIDTTIRNLGGQRAVNVDLDVLLNTSSRGLQDAFADFQVQVDVQLGLAGRSARPRGRGDSRSKARQNRAVATSAPRQAASAASTHAPAQREAKPTRVYKRGPAEPEYNLERKVTVARTLDQADAYFPTQQPLALPTASSYANSMVAVPATMNANGTTMRHVDETNAMAEMNAFYGMPLHPSQYMYSHAAHAPQQYQTMQMPAEHASVAAETHSVYLYANGSYAPQSQAAAQIAYGATMYGQHPNQVMMNDESMQWISYPSTQASSFAYINNSFTPSSYTPTAVSTSSGPYRDGGFF